jgi:Uma2 family endonuclease
MSVQVSRRKFTVSEYHRMLESGILAEDDRVELIEGEIVEMTPIGPRHAACVDRLNALLSSQAGGRAIVRVQNPVRLGEQSEPQPDLTLLNFRPDFYAQSHPGPGDILLLIEVVETSAEYDRQIKVPLYARAGIREVWVVDLGADAVEVYREPAPEGYRQVSRLGRGTNLSPEALPGLTLAVDRVLG